MGCGCGAGGTKNDYQVTYSNGTSQTFTTEADARLALAKAGNGGTIRAVPRV